MMLLIYESNFFYAIFRINIRINHKNQMIRYLSQLCYKCANSKKPNLSVISPQLQQAQMTAEMMESQMAKRKQQLIQLHTQTQKLIDSKVKFPIKLCGNIDKYEERFFYLPERVLSYYKIPKKTITSYLLKIYKASLYAIADRNKQYMEEYWESGLTEKIMEVLENMKQEYAIQVQEENDFLDYYQESCEMIDAVMVRGLSMKRQENMPPNSYIKFVQDKEVSLITYTPKHLTQGGQEFIDPKANKTVYDGYEKMVMRVLIRIKTPLKINIKEFQVDPNIDTREHLCLMENQMVAPPHLQSSYKIETLMEWLGKYRFGLWKVVDIDNFMKGNSLFRNYIEDQEVEDVFKGTKLDKSSHIDIRSF